MNLKKIFWITSFVLSTFTYTYVAQAEYVPFPVGSGTSKQRIERGLMTSACSSSPCTLVSSTAGVTNVTRTGTGIYFLNFPSGTFSETPTCNVTGEFAGSGSGACVPFSSFSATQVEVICRQFASPFNNQDDAFGFVCMGNR